MNDAIGVEVGECLCRDRNSPQCGREVVCEIAPGIESNSHPLTPLGALAASTQDHGMCPNTGQCVGALWHSKDDTLAQTFA